MKPGPFDLAVVAIPLVAEAAAILLFIAMVAVWAIVLGGPS